jgi:hypothetical protein
MVDKLKGWTRRRIVFTDVVTDPDGTIGPAHLERLAAKDEEVQQPRRGRPLDPVFDSALISLCQEKRVRLRLNQETLALAEAIMARRYGAFSQDSVRQRVKLLLSRAKKFPPA